MKYFLGIDGGGTKTAICAASTDGDVIGRFEVGALNGNGQSFEKIDESIAQIPDALNKMNISVDDCLGIGIGAAGISNRDVAERIIKSFSGAGFKEITLFGDDDAAYYDAFKASQGILLIAGTGSCAITVTAQGKKLRTGGFGHLIDDKGSAYDIAVQILEAVVRAHDGRGDETVLSDLVFDVLSPENRTVEELVRYIYAPGRTKKDIAVFAKCLQDAVSSGDRVADEIAHRAAESLFELVCTLQRKVPEIHSLRFTGSVITKNEYIYDYFVSEINSHNLDIITDKEPVDAARGAAFSVRDKYYAEDNQRDN